MTVTWQVCLLSAICANSEALFTLRVGQLFECDFQPALFDKLGALLMEEPLPRTRNPFAAREPEAPAAEVAERARVDYGAAGR